MKKINISTLGHPNTFALVDDCDFTELNKHKWYASEPYKGKLYAYRTIRKGNKRTSIRMHTEILGYIDGKIIDHRSGNGLNNQRYNLRHCTHMENTRNQTIRSNNTSGFKGVGWSMASKKWKAYIVHNSVQVHLGLFFCIIKAAEAYDNAAKRYYGKFANLNFVYDFEMCEKP